MINSILIDILSSFFLSSVEETFNTFFCFFVCLKLLWIDSIRADKTTVCFSYTNQDRSVFHEKFRSPVTDITITLNDKTLSLQSFFDFQLFKLFFVAKNLTRRIIDTQTSSLFSSSNTMVMNVLTSCDSSIVNISSTIKYLILIFY